MYPFIAHSQINRFLIQLAGKFMPVAEIRSASQVLDINTNNHRPEQEIFIGISTKTLIYKLFEEETYHQLITESFTLLFIHFI